MTTDAADMVAEDDALYDRRPLLITPSVVKRPVAKMGYRAQFSEVVAALLLQKSTASITPSAGYTQPPPASCMERRAIPPTFKLLPHLRQIWTLVIFFVNITKSFCYSLQKAQLSYVGNLQQFVCLWERLCLRRFAWSFHEISFVKGHTARHSSKRQI